MVRISGIALLLVALALTALPTADAAVQSGSSAQLAAIVRLAESRHASRFAPFRGTRAGSDRYGTSYHVVGSLAKICKACALIDEYAGHETNERWVMQFVWNVREKWSQARTSVYAQSVIGPLLGKGYARSEGADANDGALWTDWSNKTTGAFVYVEAGTQGGTAALEVRVGQYVAKNVNFVKWSQPLTPGQRSDLASAAAKFVTVGVQNAGANFAALRGKTTAQDNTSFDADVTFGDILAECSVSTIAPADGVTGKWILECATPALYGDKDDMEHVLSTAIDAALPSDFSRTTDPSLLFLSDYRWDRSYDDISVVITSFDEGDGSLKYTIDVYHFIS